MSGCLYQLEVNYADPTPGDVVKIDGAWDTYARILSLKENGFHLMRGLGHQKPSGLNSGRDIICGKDKR